MCVGCWVAGAVKAAGAGGAGLLKVAAVQTRLVSLEHHLVGCGGSGTAKGMVIVIIIILFFVICNGSLFSAGSHSQFLTPLFSLGGVEGRTRL